MSWKKAEPNILLEKIEQFAKRSQFSFSRRNTEVFDLIEPNTQIKRLGKYYTVEKNCKKTYLEN